MYRDLDSKLSSYSSTKKATGVFFCMLFLKKIKSKVTFCTFKCYCQYWNNSEAEIHIVLMIDTECIHMTSRCLEILDDATEQFNGLHIYGMFIKWDLF